MTVPKLRAPILLVHGLFGFDKLRLGGWTLASYFPGIEEHLLANGNRVLVARLSPTGGIAQRAEQLKTFLDQECPHDPVHIIAHSMGGLDCRYLVSRLDMAGRVLTLTTIGTPHRGTTFADWGLRWVERFLTPVFDAMGMSRQGFHDLTTAACRSFNAEVPDASGVRYFSVAGRHEGHWLSPEWQLSQRIVGKAEGPNDGVVSIASATYGESMDIWEGDHFSLINWPNPIAQVRGKWEDRAPYYGKLVQRLADEGF